MSRLPKNPSPDILRAAEDYSLDEAVERYNELVNENDPDLIPVLIISTGDFVGGESDDELCDENLSDGNDTDS